MSGHDNNTDKKPFIFLDGESHSQHHVQEPKPNKAWPGLILDLSIQISKQ